MRSFESLAPNLLWVSDITYIVVSDGFAYLSLITDAYSKKIMGFYLSKTLEAIKASISGTGLSAATWSSTVAKQVCWRCCPCINCIPFYCKNHTALKLLTLCVYLQKDGSFFTNSRWQQCYYKHSKTSQSKINYPVSGTFLNFDKTLKVENYCKENFKRFLGGTSRQRTAIKSMVSRNLKG